MTYENKQTFNDMTSYGGFKPAYAGAKMPPKAGPYEGPNYGASGSNDYMKIFAAAAGQAYGAISALYDRIQGGKALLGDYGGVAGNYGSDMMACKDPTCPHHGLNNSRSRGYSIDDKVKPRKPEGRYLN